MTARGPSTGDVAAEYDCLEQESGSPLTPFGVSLVARYRKIERDAASAVRKELAALRTDIARPKKSVSR